LITENQSLPRERHPAVTVVLLEADAPNLATRLREVAAQDYLGPMEIIAVAAKNPASVAGVLAEEGYASVLPKPAKGAAALEAALEETRGAYLAVLPRGSHPNAIWIDEMVSAAAAHPDALAIAPCLVRGVGAVVAAGAERGEAGWRGRAAKTQDSAETVEAALGDGMLISAAVLRECLPLDADLDARALGVDLSMRAKRLGRAIVVAPRARIVISARSGEEAGNVAIDPASELLLIATHEPAALAGALGRSDAWTRLTQDSSEELVRKALARAGTKAGKDSVRFWTESLAGAWARSSSARAEAGELAERLRALDKEHQQSLADLHREMAWAHELGERDREREESLARAKREAESLQARNQQLIGERESLAERAAAGKAREEKLGADLAKSRETQQKTAAELGDAKRGIERLETQVSNLQQTRARLETQLSDARERMRAEEEAHAATRAALAAETNVRKHLETELAAAREALRASEAALAQTQRSLDESRSAHAERVADLARLRDMMLRERDLAAERIVGLIEETRRRRILLRPLEPWKREFLEGPGAGYVTRATR
jgi:hypothetical protein